MISRNIEIIGVESFNAVNNIESDKYKTSELSDFTPKAAYTLETVESGYNKFSVSEGISIPSDTFYIKNNKIVKLIASDNTSIITTKTNKIIKLAKFGTKFKTVVDVCNDYMPPTTSVPKPTDPPPDPIAPPPIVYLFSGVNPDTYLVENWYDTNLNSQGPNGKIYIHVGLVDTDSEIL